MNLLVLSSSAPAPVFLVLMLVILLAPAAERFRLPGVIGLMVAGVVVWARNHQSDRAGRDDRPLSKSIWSE